MILLDANILLYARVESFEQHTRARKWLDEQLNGVTGVGIPWPTLLAFVRLISNRRVFERPLTTREAWHQVEHWLDCEPVWTPAPTERHRGVMSSLVPRIGNRQNLVPDAHLAALAIDNGLKLCSTDGDFARFPGLAWENPLAD